MLNAFKSSTKIILKHLSKLILFITFLLLYLTISAQNNFNLIHLPEAYKLINQSTYLSSKVVVAIIDKGVDLDHEDLADNIWLNEFEIMGNSIDDDMNGFIDDMNGWNFMDSTNDVSIDGIGNYHGTPVNGIIGACYNSYGVKGVCKNVMLLNLVKDNSIESIENSLRYIYKMRKSYNESNGQKGAFIVAVNCSWGKDSLLANDYPNWCSLYDSLGAQGILCVSSVPNDNVNVEVYSDMPTTCSSDFLITVTNTDQYDRKVASAAYGNISVDIGAPGNNSYTTLNTGGYGYFSGTSAASPYVTGAVALMYSLPIKQFHEDINKTPSETALLIKSSILDGVDQLTSLYGKTTSGGRLNVFKSMKIICDHYNAYNLYENIFNSTEILSVFPNPIESNAYVLIESKTEKNICLDVQSINGQKTISLNTSLREGIQNIELDLSFIQKGIYILKISDENEIRTIKIIK